MGLQGPLYSPVHSMLAVCVDNTYTAGVWSKKDWSQYRRRVMPTRCCISEYYYDISVHKHTSQFPSPPYPILSTPHPTALPLPYPTLSYHIMSFLSSAL